MLNLSIQYSEAAMEQSFSLKYPQPDNGCREIVTKRVDEWNLDCCGLGSTVMQDRRDAPKHAFITNWLIHKLYLWKPDTTPRYAAILLTLIGTLGPASSLPLTYGPTVIPSRQSISSGHERNSKAGMRMDSTSSVSMVST